MVFIRFLFWSIVIHAVLAAGLAWYLARMPRPTVVATLDLSSVELSFAEEERETQPTVVSSASSQTGADQEEIKTSPPPTLEMPLGDDGVAVPPLPPQPEVAVEMPPDEKMEAEAVPASHSEIVSAAPRQAHIDAPPRPLRTIKPDYPWSARKRGEQGDVQLELAITADGSVSSVSIVSSSGYNDLDAAAVKAVKLSRFNPAKSNDKPVASTARLTLTFRLKQS